MGQSGFCSHRNSAFVNKYKNASNATKRSAISTLRHQQSIAHKKAVHLRTLERAEHNKLYKNQRNLEDNRNNLAVTQDRYTRKLNELNQMKARKTVAVLQYIKIYDGIKYRIRDIYKTQRKGFFELLLTSNDINTFIDRLHFEEIIMKEDYKRMQQARQKAEEIARLETSIQLEQQSLNKVKGELLRQQHDIENNIAFNKKMIDKLKTNRAYYERTENELAAQSASLEAMLARRPASASSGIKVTTGFMRPLSGQITSPFGYRTHPIFHTKKFHSGVDIAAPLNTPIRASNSGKVIMAGWYGGYGKVVIIDHGIVRGQPITTLYGHMNSISVRQGQSVKKGQVVGHVGSTGYSTGPHCHFEVRIKGQPRNPFNYI